MILIFSVNINYESVVYWFFSFLKFEVRGVRKVIIGIIGLWWLSVYSDVVFWFFDVGFFYYIEVEFGKCWIVYLLIGNVSWVNNLMFIEFCFGMIGRVDIEGLKSDVVMNVWLL